MAQVITPDGIPAAAGPSRVATVADEDVEMAAESTVTLAPAAATATNGVNGDANGHDDVDDDGEGGKDDLGPDGLPKNACETLYLHNLNEKVRIPVMKETLASLFKPYRPVAPVIAHENIRMRGQAFVSFGDKASADLARREVNEFPLYGKPVIISFARSRADAIVQRIEGDGALEEFKKQRLEEKKVKRSTNPVRIKARIKHKSGTDEAPTIKKPRLQMPDEYLPPNNVLFVQNLPEGTTQDDLRDVFEQHAGLLEIRTIPAKRDIAFVEFADEATATVAKDALHNFKIDGETKMKVTYARK